jgi:hypothetical protein
MVCICNRSFLPAVFEAFLDGRVGEAAGDAFGDAEVFGPKKLVFFCGRGLTPGDAALFGVVDTLCGIEGEEDGAGEGAAASVSLRRINVVTLTLFYWLWSIHHCICTVNVKE